MCERPSNFSLGDGDEGDSECLGHGHGHTHLLPLHLDNSWKVSKFPKKPKRLNNINSSKCRDLRESLESPCSDNSFTNKSSGCSVLNTNINNTNSYNNYKSEVKYVAYKIKSVSTLLSPYLLIALVLINLWGNVSQVGAVCVWQGGGSFRLACGFRQSGLFRIRSLGGLKGYLGAGFTIGDEDGFKDSLTNTDPKPGQGQSLQQGGYGGGGGPVQGGYKRSGVNELQQLQQLQQIQQQQKLQQRFTAYSHLNEDRHPTGPNNNPKVAAMRKQQEQLRYLQQIQAEQLLEHQVLQQKASMNRQQKQLPLQALTSQQVPQYLQFNRRQLDPPTPTPPGIGRGGLTKRASLWGWPFSKKNQENSNSNNNNRRLRVPSGGQGHGQSPRFRAQGAPIMQRERKGQEGFYSFQNQPRPLGPIGGGGGFDPRFQGKDASRYGYQSEQEFEEDLQFEDQIPIPIPQGRQGDAALPSQMMMPPPSRSGQPAPKFKQIPDDFSSDPSLRGDTSHLQHLPGGGPNSFMPEGLKMLQNTQNFGSLFRIVHGGGGGGSNGISPQRKQYIGPSQMPPKREEVEEEEIPVNQLRPQHRQLKEDDEEMYLSGVGSMDKNALATAVYDPNVFPDIYFTTTERGNKNDLNRISNEENPDDINRLLEADDLIRNSGTFEESPAVRRKKIRRRRKKFRLLKKKGRLALDSDTNNNNPEGDTEGFERQVQTQAEEQGQGEAQGESVSPPRRRKKGRRKKFRTTTEHELQQTETELSSDTQSEKNADDDENEDELEQKPTPKTIISNSVENSSRKKLHNSIESKNDRVLGSMEKSQKKFPNSGESKSDGSYEKSRKKYNPSSVENKNDRLSSSVEKLKKKVPHSGESNKSDRLPAGSMEKSRKKYPGSGESRKSDFPGGSQEKSRKKVSNSEESSRERLADLIERFKEEFPEKFPPKRPNSGEVGTRREQLSSSSAEHVFYPSSTTTTTTMSTFGYYDALDKKVELNNNPPSNKYNEENHHDNNDGDDDVNSSYDPRYPPTHEVNRGRIPNKFIRQRKPTPPPPSTTPTPYHHNSQSQYSQYNRSGYAPSSNSFFGNLPSAETTKFSPASDFASTFVHLDSRETMKSIEKTKNYNDQFYSSHFNKSSFDSSPSASSYLHGNLYGVGPTAFSNPGFYDLSPSLSQELQPPRPYPQYPPRAPTLSDEMILPWERKSSSTTPKPSPVFPKYSSNYVNRNNNGFPSGTMETFGLPSVTTPINSIDEENEDLKRNLFGGNSGGDEPGENGNWEAPNFWGNIQEVDRYGPAADFVTNDNFKRVLDLERQHFHPSEIPPQPAIPHSEDDEADESYSDFFGSTPGSTRWAKPRRKQKSRPSPTPNSLPSSTVTPRPDNSLSEEVFNLQPGWDVTGSTESSFGMKLQGLNEIEGNYISSTTEAPEQIKRIRNKHHGKRRKHKRPDVQIKIKGESQPATNPDSEGGQEVIDNKESEVQSDQQVILPNTQEVIDILQEADINRQSPPPPTAPGPTPTNSNLILNFNSGQIGQNYPELNNIIGASGSGQSGQIQMSDFSVGSGGGSVNSNGAFNNEISAAIIPNNNNNIFPQGATSFVYTHREPNPFSSYESGYKNDPHGFVSSNAEFSDLSKQINQMTVLGNIPNSQNQITMMQHRESSEEHKQQIDPPRQFNNNEFGQGGGLISQSLEPPGALPAQLPNIVPSPPDPLLRSGDLHAKIYGNNNNDNNKNKLSEFPTSIPVLLPPPMPLSPDEIHQQQKQQQNQFDNNEVNDNNEDDLIWQKNIFNKAKKIDERYKNKEPFKIIPHPIQILNIQNNVPLPPTHMGSSLGFNDNKLPPGFNLNFASNPPQQSFGNQLQNLANPSKSQSQSENSDNEEFGTVHQELTQFIQHQMKLQDQNRNNNFKIVKPTFESAKNSEFLTSGQSIKIVRPTNLPNFPPTPQQHQHQQPPPQFNFNQNPRNQKPRPQPPSIPHKNFYPPLRDESIKFDENRNNFHPHPQNTQPYLNQQQRPQSINSNGFKQQNNQNAQQNPPQPPNYQKNQFPNPKKYRDQVPKVKSIAYDPPSPQNNFNKLPLPHNPYIINSNQNNGNTNLNFNKVASKQPSGQPVQAPTKIPAQKFQPPPPPPSKPGFLSPITSMFSNPFSRSNNNNKNNNGRTEKPENSNNQRQQNQFHKQVYPTQPMNNNNNNNNKYQQQQQNQNPQFQTKPYPPTTQMTKSNPSQNQINNHMNPFNNRFKPPPPASHSQNTLNLNLKPNPRPTQNGIDVTYVDLDNPDHSQMVPFPHSQGPPPQQQQNHIQQQQQSQYQQFQPQGSPRAPQQNQHQSRNPSQPRLPQPIQKGLTDKQKVLQAIATLNNVKYDVIQSVAEEQFGPEMLEKLKSKKAQASHSQSHPPPPPTRPPTPRPTTTATTTTLTTTIRPALFPFLSAFTTTKAPVVNTHLKTLFNFINNKPKSSQDLQTSPSGMSNLLSSFGGYGDSAISAPKSPSLVSMSTDAITNLFHSLTSGETKPRVNQQPSPTPSTTTTSRPQLTPLDFGTGPEAQDIKSLQAQLAKAIIAKANRKKFVAQAPPPPNPSNNNNPTAPGGGNPLGLLSQLATSKNYTQAQIATLKKLIALNNIEQKLNTQLGTEHTTKGSLLKIGSPTMKSPSSSIFSGLLQPSGPSPSSYFSNKMLMDSSSDLNSINQVQVQNNFMGSNDPTLLALKALALKKAQNINPQPNQQQHQQSQQQSSINTRSKESSNSDFKPIPVDLSAILSPSPPLEETRKRRLTDVRNAPKSFYPANATMGFDSLPSLSLNTDFECESQTYFPGLYADTELGCKVFHLCAKTDAGYLMKSFRCPKETVFDQEVLKCNWNLYVDCPASQNKYHFNKYLSQSFQFLKVLGEFSAGIKKNNSTHSSATG